MMSSPYKSDDADERYVLLVVSGTTRNNDRLHVLEFRSEDALIEATKFLEGFSGKFTVKIIDDSV